MILPLASEGGCQLTMMVRGLFSLLTTVTSFGEELGTVGGFQTLKNCAQCAQCARLNDKLCVHSQNVQSADVILNPTQRCVNVCFCVLGALHSLQTSGWAENRHFEKLHQKRMRHFEGFVHTTGRGW